MTDVEEFYIGRSIHKQKQLQQSSLVCPLDGLLLVSGPVITDGTYIWRQAIYRENQQNQYNIHVRIFVQHAMSLVVQ